MSKRGKYSPEYKEQAVKRAISGSFTIKEVSESLGISYHVLRQWKAEFLKKSDQTNPPTDKQLKESEELKIVAVLLNSDIPSKWRKSAKRCNPLVGKCGWSF